MAKIKSLLQKHQTPLYPGHEWLFIVYTMISLGLVHIFMCLQEKTTLVIMFELEQLAC